MIFDFAEFRPRVSDVHLSMSSACYLPEMCDPFLKQNIAELQNYASAATSETLSHSFQIPMHLSGDRHCKEENNFQSQLSPVVDSCGYHVDMAKIFIQVLQDKASLFVQVFHIAVSGGRASVL